MSVMDELFRKKKAYGMSMGLGPDQYITIVGPDKKWVEKHFFQALGAAAELEDQKKNEPIGPEVG